VGGFEKERVRAGDREMMIRSPIGKVSPLIQNLCPQM